MVKVTILDKDEKLKPEMSARVTFLEIPGRSGRGATDLGGAAPAAGRS